MSVCCTRNGRHVLAVTRARRQMHAHVNYKGSIDLTGLASSAKITDTTEQIDFIPSEATSNWVRV